MGPPVDRTAAARELHRELGRTDPRDEPDGRRRRGQASRGLIIQALLDLLRADEPIPSASRVAEKAGVSLRTVYRHFNEMEALYREIAESIQVRVLPVLFEPLRAPTWRARLFELIDRAIGLFEIVMPVKIAGDLRRFHSRYLMDDYLRALSFERNALDAILPAELRADESLARALLLAIGFQTWRALRKDQGLDAVAAREVVLRTVEALLATAPPVPGSAAAES